MKNQITTAQILKALELSKTILYGGVSKFIQMAKAEDAKAVGMTKKDLGTLAFEMKLKRDLRVKASIPALGKALIASIDKKLTTRLKAGFSYRQPSSDWVSVSNIIRVVSTKGSVSIFGVSQSVVYHEKHNWKANETRHTLYLNPLDNFTTVGGLVTIFRKADKSLPAIPCKWYEQSRGFEVKEVRGFLVGDYHVEAESAEKALELVARRRKVQVNALAKRKALEEKADDLKLTANLVNKEFGFCMAGIRNFCEVNGIDPKASYTLKDLRNIVVNNRGANCGIYESYLKRLGISLNCK